MNEWDRIGSKGQQVKKGRRKEWKGKSSALYVPGGEETPEPESERKLETHRKINENYPKIPKRHQSNSALH
jgi:hypothetical protein